MSAIPFDPLIAEAKRRMRRRRWLVGLALAAVAAVGVGSVVHGIRSSPAATAGARSAVATTNACGITVAGIRILQGGQTVYREPGQTVHPNGGPGAQVQCSGDSIWVVWLQGGGMMQEAYFGVHSSDAGRTWHPVFTERFFGRKAPHQLDSYFGPWTLSGKGAYFAGSCPACGGVTVSLYVSKDGGRTFRTYPVPALTGYTPGRISVSGHSVTVVGDQFAPGTAPHKTARVWVG